MKTRRPQSRKEAIKELVQKFSIEDQDSLVDLLKREYEIESNQSIVSRDLRQLGISKHVVGDKSIYQLPTEDPTREILRRAVLDVEKNEQLIVVHTVGGLADFVGDYLDTHRDQDILATLAGENVVFVVPKTVTTIQQVYKNVRRLLYHYETVEEQE
jgi:transcriptional regulator of arginine metabolism